MEAVPADFAETASPWWWWCCFKCQKRAATDSSRTLSPAGQGTRTKPWRAASGKVQQPCRVLECLWPLSASCRPTLWLGKLLLGPLALAFQGCPLNPTHLRPPQQRPPSVVSLSASGGRGSCCEGSCFPRTGHTTAQQTCTQCFIAARTFPSSRLLLSTSLAK